MLKNIKLSRGDHMNLKIYYRNLEPNKMEQNYLRYRLKQITEEYPEVTNIKVRLSYSDNQFHARVSGKYLKLDVTEKWSSPILLICISKLSEKLDEKLNVYRRRFGIMAPLNMEKSSVYSNIQKSI